uniref:XIAP-associated factor 1 n=1 Tax=Nicotiana tabacum TaxID=4097 RepID=A0A1S4BDM4_TOBAC|nr:PREDICTED: XIAP-associated factor 1-like [Nicotiana tabacum]
MNLTALYLNLSYKTYSLTAGCHLCMTSRTKLDVIFIHVSALYICQLLILHIIFSYVLVYSSLAILNLYVSSDRAIPSSNLDLHVAHCSRKLEKCKICGDMVPKKHAEEHFLSTHAPVTCSLCSETMAREVLTVHKGENCPQRIVTCEYCEFPLPAIDLFKHQEVCGNRTELCHLCSRYIRLRERDDHESRCNGGTNIVAESSRNISPAERDRGAPRRQPPKKRLLFTIAITGVAVLFGSLIFQRKVENSQVP